MKAESAVLRVRVRVTATEQTAESYRVAWYRTGELTPEQAGELLAYLDQELPALRRNQRRGRITPGEVLYKPR